MKTSKLSARDISVTKAIKHKSCSAILAFRICSNSSRKHIGGFTLVEILIAIVILTIAIVPMMGAFSPALTTSSGEEELVFTSQALSTLNRLSAMDFAILNSYTSIYGFGQVNLTDLFTLSGFSDAISEEALESFTLNGHSYTPTIILSDASSGAGGLYEITVTIEYVTLKAMKAEY